MVLFIAFGSAAQLETCAPAAKVPAGVALCKPIVRSSIIVVRRCASLDSFRRFAIKGTRAIIANPPAIDDANEDRSGLVLEATPSPRPSIPSSTHPREVRIATERPRFFVL
ncbi:hypothetical protein HYQ44_017078 [Verticillium longisporum]|nr:hypothetical protein HYQ44_017078 [Verticillium longisporum]